MFSMTPPPVHHVAEARASAEKCPAQVGLDHAVKGFCTHVDKAPAAADAGIVHQDIEPTKLTDRLRDETIYLRLLGHIRRDRDGMAAIHLDLRYCPFTETLPPGRHDDT